MARHHRVRQANGGGGVRSGGGGGGGIWEELSLLEVAVDSPADSKVVPNTFMRLTLDEISAAARDSDIKRENTRFFRIVKGGNVRFIRRVLRHLQSVNMDAELAWCLGDPTAQLKASKGSRCLWHLTHGLWFMFIFVITVVLTPVFYIVHTLVNETLTTFRKSLVRYVKLPLAFAVLSQEPEMVALFLEFGCQITWCDSRGNNIYHYLADLSLDKCEVAKLCHTILCSLIKDTSMHREVLTKQENHEGSTAIEYIAKYGSVIFFDFIVREPVAFGHPVFYVTKSEIWARESSVDRETEIPNGSLHVEVTPQKKVLSVVPQDKKKSLNILEVDISMYDRGDIYSRNSLLLHSIVGREVERMAEENANCILKSKLFSSWMKQKARTYLPYCLLNHVFNLGITGLLLWYLVRNGGDMNPLPLFSTYLTYLSENLKEAETQLQTLLNSTNLTDIYTIINQTKGPDYGLHTLTCLARVNHTSRGTINCTLKALTRINASCGGMPDEELWGITLGNKQANFEVIWRDKVILALLIVISTILALDIVLDLFIRLGFMCTNYNFKAKSPFVASSGFFQRWLPGSYLEKQLTVAMACLFFFYIFSHIMMMDTIDSRQVWIGQLIGFMMQGVLAQKTSVETGKVREIIRGLDSLSLRINEMEITSNKIMNICILIRFFQVIHSLRLLPNIGFFIITTKKMAKHLLQFALVFVIVSLAFGTIFNFVMRNPKCLAQKVHGFETLSSSLFSAYQISLGSSSVQFTDNNMIAKLAYIAFTITAMLLLLNLIIAVMTTTALELNKSPWRPAMCRVELWDEFLGMEVYVQSISRPLRMLCCLSCLGTQRKHKKFKPRRTIQLTFVSKAEWGGTTV